MKSTLAWDGDELVWTTTKKRRVIAKYVGSIKGDGISLQTFWNGQTYFIGVGKSAYLHVETEGYWSTVDGETFLIQFVPETGDTIALPDSSNNLLRCKKP